MSGPSPELRLAAASAAVSGVATLGIAGIVPALGTLVTMILVLLAAAASLGTPTPAEQVVRRRIAVTALTCAALTAFAVTRGDVLSSTGRVLGLLLCAAAVAHALVLDTVRDVRVNTAVSGSMLVLAAGLAPGLGIAAPVVVTWVCVVTALVLATRDAQGAAATATATPGPRVPTPWTPVAAAVATALLIGLAVALVLPHPSGLSAHTRFGPTGSATNPSTGGSGRAAQAYLGGGPLSLDARGRLPSTPVAVVTGTQPQLWRAAAMQDYDGHSWSTPPGTGRQLNPQGGSEAAVPADPRSPAQSGTGSRTDGVGWLLVTEPFPVVLSPGLLTEVRLREPGQIVQDADGRVHTSGPSATPSYVTDSDVVPSADGAGTSAPRVAATDGAADATDPAWVTLPTTVPDRVGALARQVTAGTTDRAGAVRAVETYLRDNYTYDLDSPVAPADADTVDHFLFESKAGFCEHFASAEVVMLRSLGIPSRLVTGFSGGSPDGQGRTVLLGSDAHAWVEAWIPGTGWTSSDPTASSTPKAHHESALTSLVRWLRHQLTGSPVRKVLLAGVLVVVAALAVLLPGGRRRRPAGAPARVATAPLFAAFHRLEDALATVGRPRGQAESVRALAVRLREQSTTDDVLAALRTVEDASYAAAPPTRAEAQAAAEVIDRTAARLLADAEPQRTGRPG